MTKIIKKLGILVAAMAVFSSLGATTAFAQFTILPQAAKPAQCITLLTQNNEDTIISMLKQNLTRNEVLACGIITGRISLSMVPYFITYIANFLLSLVGLVCVLFIVIGGYYYIYGGLSDNKEKGKKTIYHALFGMGVAIMSWVIIYAIIAAVTS